MLGHSKIGLPWNVGCLLYLSAHSYTRHWINVFPQSICPSPYCIYLFDLWFILDETRAIYPSFSKCCFAMLDNCAALVLTQICCFVLCDEREEWREREWVIEEVEERMWPSSWWEAELMHVKSVCERSHTARVGASGCISKCRSSVAVLLPRLGGLWDKLNVVETQPPSRLVSSIYFLQPACRRSNSRH